jgi:hypothetical protein
LETYKGFLIFRLTLISSQSACSDKVTAAIVQGAKTIKSYSILPGEIENATWTKDLSAIYLVHYYLYFSKKDVDFANQLILTVTDENSQKLQFFFNLVQVR